MRPVFKSTLAGCLALALAPATSFAQRVMENLDRGVVAINEGDGKVFVGWRLLGSEPQDTPFNVYRQIGAAAPVKVNAQPLTGPTSLADTGVDLATGATYFVRPILNGQEQKEDGRFTLAANAPVRNYIEIPIKLPVLEAPPAAAAPPAAPPGPAQPAPEGRGNNAQDRGQQPAPDQPGAQPEGRRGRRGAGGGGGGGGRGGGGPLAYTVGDGSVADLDGDGKYEVIIKGITREIDSASPGIADKGILQAYKMDGTHLWTISYGKNIRESEHDTHFIVYDYDGDGRAEVALRTSDGAVDGLGQVIGDPNADWRNLEQGNAAYGKNLTEHAYMTIFDGLTGKLLAKEPYVPSPLPVGGWGGIGGNSGNDTNGTRSMRFLAGAAYLDGQLPSAIFTRGVYGRTVIAAWDWRGGKLTQKWVFDTNTHPRQGQPYIPASTTVSSVQGLNKVVDNTGENWSGARPGEAMVWDRDGLAEYARIIAVDGNTITVDHPLTAGENKASHVYGYTGMGGHSLSVADVDEDGKDEVVFKSMVVDDNGQGMFTTGWRHGDALHVGDFDITRPGLEVFGPFENETERGSPWVKWNPAAGMFDARTGETLWGVMYSVDAGSGLCGDVDPRHPGSEFWGIPSKEGNSSIYTAKGELIAARGPQMNNFAIWWDGDPLREMVGGNRVTKWDWEAGQARDVYTAQGAQAAAGTKSSPVIQADILGDWREEFILRTANSLRIYVNTDETKIRLPTLMHDPQYRLAVAWQNTCYNQPPHPSFHIGHDMKMPAGTKIRLAPRLIRE